MPEHTSGQATLLSELSHSGWRKCSRSNAEGGACVEIAATGWRKSSRSNAEGGECVEVAATTRIVAVRDSTDPLGGVLVLGPASWRTFIGAVKSGTHDLA